MAFKKVPTVQIWTILRRWADKQTLTEIAAQEGCDRKTVRSYIALAREELKLAPEDIIPERKEELLPKLQEAAERAHTKATGQLQIEPYLEEILGLVNDEDNPLKMKSAFSVIAERHELTGKVSYSSFKRWARARGVAPKKKARPTCRIETKPGEQLQIDYAKMGLLYDPLEKRRRVVYAFIGTLSFSRHKFIQFVWTQDQVSFVQSHLDMFSWFGGCTTVLTIDNLKNGVLKPHIYDPVLNRSYQDLAEFFQTHIDPCRIGASRDKGKVERDVQTARELWRRLMADHATASLAELNQLACDWLLKEYGTRKHGTTGEPPLARFRDYEQKALLRLPEAPYTIAQWGQATVHPDHYIRTMGHDFNLSSQYIGCTVQVMLTPKLAKIYYQNELIKTKALTPGQKRYTDWEDFPSTVRFALSEETPRRLVRDARRTGGEAFAELVSGLLSVPGFSYLRRVQGLEKAARDYPFAAVQEAARLALTLEGPVNTHQFAHMLERIRQEQEEAPRFEGLPLSEATESFMRTADYFLQAPEEKREVVNG
jgi:transposase